MEASPDGQERHETSADWPAFSVLGVACPVRPEATMRLVEVLERSGSQFALQAARTILDDVQAGRRVELGDVEGLEVIRALDSFALEGALDGYLATLRAQLQAWRDLA